MTFPEHIAAPIGANLRFSAKAEAWYNPARNAYMAMHKNVKPVLQCNMVSASGRLFNAFATDLALASSIVLLRQLVRRGRKSAPRMGPNGERDVTKKGRKS